MYLVTVLYRKLAWMANEPLNSQMDKERHTRNSIKWAELVWQLVSEVWSCCLATCYGTLWWLSIAGKTPTFQQVSQNARVCSVILLSWEKRQEMTLFSPRIEIVETQVLLARRPFFSSSIALATVMKCHPFTSTACWEICGCLVT